jgi:hypothetical protein
MEGTYDYDVDWTSNLVGGCVDELCAEGGSEVVWVCFWWE